MSTAGRPSSYRPEYCQLAHNYCLLGATKARLGAFFGVTSRTIDNWIATIPEFRDGVQRARNLADAQVAESLYQGAVGYSHEVERVVGRPGQEQVVRYKKSYPPETEACKHWLRHLPRGPDPAAPVLRPPVAHREHNPRGRVRRTFGRRRKRRLPKLPKSLCGSERPARRWASSRDPPQIGRRGSPPIAALVGRLRQKHK